MADETVETKPDTEAEARATEAVRAVQERVAEEQDQGYVGTTPDETPNENYTLTGVGQGLPTPENSVVHPDKQNKSEGDTTPRKRRRKS